MVQENPKAEGGEEREVGVNETKLKLDGVSQSLS